MLYAQVVLGLPVEGPFDYIVPGEFSRKIKVGARVWIPFRTRRILGYVVKLSLKTKIKNLKNILEVVDEIPTLDKNMLSLTKKLSEYYCCSWGEAIEAALPEALRKGKSISICLAANSNLGPTRTPDSNLEPAKTPDSNLKPAKTPVQDTGITLVHDLDGQGRWDVYLDKIKEALSNNKSVAVLLPDKNSVLQTKEMIGVKLNLYPEILYRKQPNELDEWLKIKEGKTRIVIGTRSSIFAPLNNLGLIIVDEEQDPVYKQEQVPHYNAREVAFMRAKLQKAKLILGSGQPSLESFYLARKDKINPSTRLRIDGESFDYAQDGSPKDGELVEPRGRTIKYTFIPRKKDFPEIKIIDTKNLGIIDRRNNVILSKYLQDSIASSLNSSGRILLFLNRKGFATFAWCRYCGTVLRCLRCNVNLVFHFKDNILNCHYCNFKMEPPSICPNCNSSYIRYSGAGAEKAESELSRLFPLGRIKRLDNQKYVDIKEADIFVSTKSVINRIDGTFDLIGVLAIDNSLNRIDFRASEKTFGLLVGLLRLTAGKLVIQTHLPGHHCFRALENKDINIFYDEELKQRKQLNFPPYKHIGLVKLRGQKEERVKKISNDLFDKLNKCNRNKNIKIISVNPACPSKLRGNFYWQILIGSGSAEKISRFLKIHLKALSHSGIIVTVDMDPL